MATVVRSMETTLLLPSEVMAHSARGDVWVTVLGRVLDVSDLADPDPAGTLGSRVLMSFAGKDVSHYFDPDTQDVCAEDTVARVLQRYEAFNSGAAERYSCVSEDGADGVVGLDPTRTLEENGILDERDLYVELGLPEDLYVPALQLIPRPGRDDDDPRVYRTLDDPRLDWDPQPSLVSLP